MRVVDELPAGDESASLFIGGNLSCLDLRTGRSIRLDWVAHMSHVLATVFHRRELFFAPPRSRIVCRVVHHGTRREFLGFNRARHAVLEAAILATRTHLLPAAEIASELARLQIIVDKTAGPRERDAMAFVTGHVQPR